LGTVLIKTNGAHLYLHYKKNMKKHSKILVAILSLGALSLSSCTSQMSNNSTANNALIGAAAGGAAGYVYDQYKKSGEGNSRAWDRSTTTRALSGAGVGAAAGALMTPQQQQAPQNYQQPVQQQPQPGYYR